MDRGSPDPAECAPPDVDDSADSFDIKAAQKEMDELVGKLKISNDKIIRLKAAATAKEEADEKILSDTEAVAFKSAYPGNEPETSGSSSGDSISRNKVTIPTTVTQDTEQASEANNAKEDLEIEEQERKTAESYE